MKKLLLTLTIVFAILMAVITGGILGITAYQMGYEQGGTDEQSCYETEGEPCEGYDAELVPA